MTRDSQARRLTACGAVAGPLFVMAVLVQDFTRPGFDPRIHLLSQLSLGSGGWIQVSNFILAGVLFVLGAAGIGKYVQGYRGGTAASALLSIFGILLVMVGIFRTDAARGFPPGVPAPSQPTLPAIIHGAGALPTFVALAAALVLLSKVHAARAEPRMSAYLLGSAFAFLFIFVCAMAIPTLTGPALQLAVLVGWTAPSLSALHLLRGGALSDTPPAAPTGRS